MQDPRRHPKTCPLVTRRQFLTGLGATVSLGVVGGYGVGLWRRDPTVTQPVSSTVASHAPDPIPAGAIGDSPSARTLVVVEMGGGNDGLSTVVPLGESAYYDLRRATAIDAPLELDTEIGLHPSLMGLATRYGQGELAIIEGVGYPDPDLSHFVSMETWWTAHASGPTASGWLGRYLDGTVGAADPLAAVAIGPGPSRALLGDTSYSISIQDASGLVPQAPWIDNVDELMGSWSGFETGGDDDDPKLEPVRRAIATATQSRTRLSSALAEPRTGSPARQKPQIVQSMELAADLITNLQPAIVYVHGWGDFDTHFGQLERQGGLLADLDDAIAAFFGRLEEAGASSQALVLTTSEFGRRAKDNGSGTDHGTAGVQLLIGPGVSGGRYGEAPSLARLDTNGNLLHTVDFRSTYATVIEDWLSADADEVLGSGYERLGFLA